MATRVVVRNVGRTVNEVVVVRQETRGGMVCVMHVTVSRTAGGRWHATPRNDQSPREEPAHSLLPRQQHAEEMRGDIDIMIGLPAASPAARDAAAPLLHVASVTIRCRAAFAARGSLPRVTPAHAAFA